MFRFRSLVAFTFWFVASVLILDPKRRSVFFLAQTHTAPPPPLPFAGFSCGPLCPLAMALFAFGPQGADLARVDHSEHYRNLGRQLAEVFGVPFAEYAAPEDGSRRWAEYAPSWDEVAFV